MLWLLSGRVEDTLAAVDLHADIQLKVDVSFGRRGAEAAVGGRARPALAEQLTHSRKARRLPVRRAGKKGRGKKKKKLSQICDGELKGASFDLI